MAWFQQCGTTKTATNRQCAAVTWSTPHPCSPDIQHVSRQRSQEQEVSLLPSKSAHSCSLDVQRVPCVRLQEQEVSLLLFRDLANLVSLVKPIARSLPIFEGYVGDDKVEWPVRGFQWCPALVNMVGRRNVPALSKDIKQHLLPALERPSRVVFLPAIVYSSARKAIGRARHEAAPPYSRIYSSLEHREINCVGTSGRPT